MRGYGVGSVWITLQVEGRMESLKSIELRKIAGDSVSQPKYADNVDGQTENNAPRKRL